MTEADLFDRCSVMAEAPDWISAIANLLTGGAAVAAAWHAVRSLKAWRSEAIGRRKVEVAEDVLAGFYRVREIIFDARAPFVRAQEMQAGEGEDPELIAKSGYAPWRRIKSQWPFLMEWRSKRHTFAAWFGRESSTPYDEIERVLTEIRAAVESLVEHHEVPHSTIEYRDFIQFTRRIAFRTTPPKEEDAVTKRVDDAVAAVEATCRPVIEESARKK